MVKFVVCVYWVVLVKNNDVLHDCEFSKCSLLQNAK